MLPPGASYSKNTVQDYKFLSMGHALRADEAHHDLKQPKIGIADEIDVIPEIGLLTVCGTWRDSE